MNLQYKLNIHQLMDFFCEGEHQGFTEQEIQTAEQTIGVTLPSAYRSFLLTYGRDTVNTVYNSINCPPDEIYTSYQAIQEELEDWEPEFEEAVENGSQDQYADNEYFKLWQLPVEKWNTVTENYVLIWCENQGVWNAGFLLQDLLSGIPNPPVYITTNDDLVSFQKCGENIEQFLLEMLREAACEYDSAERYTSQPEIRKILKAADIDPEKLKQAGRVGICLNTDTKTLYFYCEHTDYPELISVEKIESDNEE